MTKINKKTIAKSFLIFGFVLLNLFGTAKPVYAQMTGIMEGGWGAKIFKFILEAFVGAIDIRATTMSAFQTAAVEGPSFALSNRSFDGYMNCSLQYYGSSIPFPDDTIDPNDDCSDLYVATPISGMAGRPTQNKGQGSLMGLAIVMEDITLNEPVPVNLAYYVRREAADIPIVSNTAFAQTALGEDFLLQSVYEVWTRLRNVAYGLLALFMIIIGIMIMIRHKVNPQTVVTIQQAIPKIVISVILITFSYPIIALAIGLIMPLSGVGVAMIGDIPNLPPLMTGISGLGAGPLLIVPGSGMALALLVLVAVIVGLIFLIKLIITILACYIKLIVSMLTGPFVFAWGAIPGNEKAITDWFKKVGVNIMAVPIMIAGLQLTRFITHTMAQQVISGGGSTGSTSGVTSELTAAGPSVYGMMFIYPLITIVMLLQFGKVPKMLEENVLGKKRK